MQRTRALAREDGRKVSTPFPMVLQAKIQGDCAAIVRDVCHTSKLRRFGLIDPRTKTKFPGKWRSSGRRRLLFDPGVTTASPLRNSARACTAREGGYMRKPEIRAIMFPKQRIYRICVSIRAVSVQVHCTNVHKASLIFDVRRFESIFNQRHRSIDCSSHGEQRSLIIYLAIISNLLYGIASIDVKILINKYPHARN